MVYLSVILFFVYCWGFGLGLGRLAKEADDFLERNIMRIGTGLGGMLAFGFLLNLLRIPLDWRIFLLVSLTPIALSALKLLKKGSFSNFGFGLNKYHLIAILLFLISLHMYAKGAFAYPYLEDDDSWSHALGAKYVAIEKTVFSVPKNLFHYLDPYPPAYDLLLGIMHQSNSSVFFTLKFFNALIISLSVIFFYFFAKELGRNAKKALFAAFALFAVPAFMSHFIWSISLTMPLFFVCFYAAEKIKHDKKWWIIAAIAIMPTVTSSPTHSAYFGLFFVVYFIARTLVERRLLVYEFLAGISGLALSFVLWWLPMIMMHGLRNVYKTFVGGTLTITNIVGTGDRAYTLSEFIFAKKTNMINSPIGIGIVLSILAAAGIVLVILKYRELLQKENYFRLVMLLWFVLAFYAVNAARFPVRLSPFRAWMLLAIPISLLAGEAITWLGDLAKSFARNFTQSKVVVGSAYLLVLLTMGYGIITTSFVQKYSVNTAFWGPGGFWTSNEEIQGYIWFKDNVPAETNVFTFSNNALVIGLDKFICHWCSDVIDYQRNGFNQSPSQNHEWLKRQQYRYLVIDGQTAKLHGANETGDKLNDLINSGLFRPVYSTKGFILLQAV